LAGSKWQFVGAVKAEAISDVKNRQPVIPDSVLRVHHHAGIRNRLRAGDRGGVIEALRVCVIGPESESAAKAPVQIHVERIEIVDGGSKEFGLAPDIRIAPRRARASGRPARALEKLSAIGQDNRK